MYTKALHLKGLFQCKNYSYYTEHTKLKPSYVYACNQHTFGLNNFDGLFNDPSLGSMIPDAEDKKKRSRNTCSHDGLSLV